MIEAPLYIHLYLSAAVNTTTSWASLALLQVAARQQLATLLIDRGSSVHALDMQQCTPLHLACKGGLIELTSCLINLGAFIDTISDSGKFLVH